MKFDVNDIVGKKFGKLTVLSFSESKKKSDNRHYYHYYLCKCDCGNTKVIERGHLLSHHTLSCGCLQVETLKKAFTKHNLSNHRLHRIWDKMKYRCLNPKFPRYQDYGGRGITICQEWLDDFMNFYNWAINNGYADNLSIDRIDVNGNYEPKNCRWADNKTQGRNTRYNHLITFCGQTRCLSEWAEKYDILPDTLQMRLSRGWNIRKALLTPVKKN